MQLCLSGSYLEIREPCPHQVPWRPSSLLPSHVRLPPLPYVEGYTQHCCCGRKPEAHYFIGLSWVSDWLGWVRLGSVGLGIGLD